MGAMIPGLDDAYSPLGGPEGWPAPAEDVTTAAARCLSALSEEAPAWADMVRQGMLLAAAYRSGALAGLHGADEDRAAGLLSGVATAASCGPVAAPHVLSNHAALELAVDAAAGSAPATEAWLRRLHAVACAPQVTHPVPGDHGVHDHVLGHGDYKHHPNHVRTGTGDWQVFAPVGRVGPEMAALASTLVGDAFAALDPVARAAYSLYAVTHVGPFAAGNGRVARALASVPLFGAAALPLAVPAFCAAAYRCALGAAGHGEPVPLVDLVAQRCTGLVDAVVQARSGASCGEAVAALRRWEGRAGTANRLQDLLPAAAEAALGRHRRRSDLGWMDDLAAARVMGPPAGEDASRFHAAPVTIQMATGDGPTVQEVLAINAHPLAGPDDVVRLRAVRAELDVDVRAGDVASPVPADFTSRLDGLLDRAVTALAVRAAAGEDA